jgi:hypothetical protein
MANDAVSSPDQGRGSTNRWRGEPNEGLARARRRTRWEISWSSFRIFRARERGRRPERSESRCARPSAARFPIPIRSADQEPLPRADPSRSRGERGNRWARVTARAPGVSLPSAGANAPSQPHQLEDRELSRPGQWWGCFLAVLTLALRDELRRTFLLQHLESLTSGRATPFKLHTERKVWNVIGRRLHGVVQS